MSSKEFFINKKGFAVSSLLLVLVIFATSCNRGNPSVKFASTSDPGIPNAPINNGAPTGAVVPVTSYADIVSRVSPAVITIHSEQRVRTPQQFPFMNDPMFRQFFGGEMPEGRNRAPRARKEQ